jgi:hypothetical protein
MTVLERETPCEAPMSDVDDMDGMAEELWQVWKSVTPPPAEAGTPCEYRPRGV